MARIYDPNGLVAPAIVGNKIFRQDLWRAGIQWDEKIPCSLYSQWHEFKQNVAALNGIKIPRWIGTGPNKQVQLHFFADASEKAMGSVAYARITDENGNTSIHMVTSKSKV